MQIVQCCFHSQAKRLSLFTKKVETHKRERKNTVITKITLTISNGEHIKQTLSTNKPYHHQQHLPKISQNVSGAVRMAIRYFQKVKSQSSK